MSESPLKEMASHRELKAGHFVFEFDTPGIGYILKHAGCDFTILDTEHSGFGIETVRRVMAFMRAAELPTIVRSPSRDYKDIARTLDAGAGAVMLPMVSNADEAKSIIHSIPLDMKFIAHDPYVDPALAADLGVTLTDLDTAFREADFVCVNCPLSDETHHLVDRGRLAQMKPTAFLVNTARGPIVDQAALTEALQEGRIAGAGIDVFEQEPPDADDPLLTLDNVIVTPHALCWTDQLFAGSGAADVRAVMAVMAGRVPTGIVNRDVVDRPGWKARLAAYAQEFGAG